MNSQAELQPYVSLRCVKRYALSLEHLWYILLQNIVLSTDLIEIHGACNFLGGEIQVAKARWAITARVSLHPCTLHKTLLLKQLENKAPCTAKTQIKQA